MSNLTLKHSPDSAIDGGLNYLDPFKLFYAYFDKIPSSKEIDGIDDTSLRQWIESNVKYSLRHYKNLPQNTTGFSSFYLEVHYILEEGIIIQVEEESVKVLFDDPNTETADYLISKCMEFEKKSDDNPIHLVVVSNNSIHTHQVAVKVPFLDLGKQYNDDLMEMDQKIRDILTENGRSGLILFHGKPGTGKSTYIRFLIKDLQKKVIFMTSDMAGNLGSPEIAKFLIHNANSIFIIEDAEQLFVSRDMNKGSSLSTLLNLTDGILGKSLGIQIIATFNTDLHNIDKALLRKGRLLALYEFKPLEKEKCRSLFLERGMPDAEITGPLTLADIFNYNEPEYAIPGMARIGFINI